jgi:type VI secretion system protein ImpK
MKPGAVRRCSFCWSGWCTNQSAIRICWSFYTFVFHWDFAGGTKCRRRIKEFEQIYRRLHHVLHSLRGDAPFPLLHQDKKTQGGRYQLIKRLTVKHILLGSVTVLALFYLFYLLRLDSQTQDILHQLNRLLAR